MNRIFWILIAIISVWSCSSREMKVQFLFPLGMTIEDFMQDDYIKYHKSSCSFLSEMAVEKELKDNYVCEDGIGGIHHEDNFNGVDDLKGVKAVRIKNYAKDGICYTTLYLFFKTNKLIQVYADTEGDSNLAKVQAMINNASQHIGDTLVNKSFGQTYYLRKDTTYVEYDAKQMKTRDVYFEVTPIDESDDRIYYTYYTFKVLPLFGVDY